MSKVEIWNVREDVVGHTTVSPRREVFEAERGAPAITLARPAPAVAQLLRHIPVSIARSPASELIPMIV